MVDPLVQCLLEQAIDSPVKLHLLLIFHENPRMEVTPQTIAERICRDIWSVSQALSELADAGIMLHAASANGEALYRYGPSGEHIEAIRRLLRGYDDPLARDHLQRVIRDLASYAPYRRSNNWDTQFA
ncbi:MAG: hypothetical protein AB4911_14560 [Oscillochloridaceae bacterium umkhey_bin13]